jgi:hypothetical protein
MTKLLQKAFDEASKLPEGEQDALGRILLEELASERRWEDLFAGSHDLLGDLADQALAEHRAGGLRSSIRKNCDLAHHCAVPENVRRTACRGSTSSPSRISHLPAKSESYESSFQACPSFPAHLLCSD